METTKKTPASSDRNWLTKENIERLLSGSRNTMITFQHLHQRILKAFNDESDLLPLVERLEILNAKLRVILEEAAMPPLEALTQEPEPPPLDEARVRTGMARFRRRFSQQDTDTIH